MSKKLKFLVVEEKNGYVGWYHGEAAASDSYGRDFEVFVEVDIAEEDLFTVENYQYYFCTACSRECFIATQSKETPTCPYGYMGKAKISRI